jgi:transposase
MRRVLAGWIRETRSMPGWFLDATASLSVWRSPARLAALVRDWRETRFNGDNAMFDAVEGWRKQDKHLWCWETAQRAKSLARRRDYYRVTAAKLAENFGTVILEDFDLRAVARVPEVDSDKNHIKQAARNRTLAAVSELRLAIINAFRMRGGSVHLIDPANTTRECHVCGVVEAFDAASKLRHTCANGHEWDQDENAAKNIFERWRRAQDVATARNEEESMPSEARWARAKRMKRERDERLDRSKGEAV